MRDRKVPCSFINVGIRILARFPMYCLQWITRSLSEVTNDNEERGIQNNVYNAHKERAKTDFIVTRSPT